MVNKTLGNRFEQELCELLAENGFWAHNLAQNQAGQSADVIAVKNDGAVLIDCKVCSKNRFLLSRVEENQEMAMHRWLETENSECYFAVQLSDGEIHMVHSEIILAVIAARRINLNVQASFSEAEIRSFPTFQEWVEWFG